MKLDAFVTSLSIERAGEYAAALERNGFHGLWVAETQVDPLLPLAAAAVATRTLRLGTGIAIAFARSPMVVAMDAWALQRASAGRLDLGLGTQVRAHVERRFAMPYDRPRVRARAPAHLGRVPARAPAALRGRVLPVRSPLAILRSGSHRASADPDLPRRRERADVPRRGRGRGWDHRTPVLHGAVPARGRDAG